MLSKLSLRNAKRQARDYMIYFITIIISVSLMFSFNSIAVSDDIKELSSYMEDFSDIINGISIIIIFIISWLINYCMKFMLEKRSKEFGTYEILGIEKKSISNIFTLENLIIGIIAFGIGIFVGTFLYQILTSIIMNLFNKAYQIKVTFDLKAVGITAIYFFGIFGLVLLNSRRKIKKTKVYDLLYADKKNENNIIKRSKGNILIFILSLVLLIGAIYISNTELKNISDMTGRNIFISVVMLIIGIYLFYISISSFIVKIYLENKKRKYKRNNMFLYRNLTSKINTMSITIGTIALMFTIILIGGNLALLFNSLLNNELEMGYPYEIMISKSDNDFSEFKEYIQKNADVKDMYEYKIYYIQNLGISKVFKDTVFEEANKNRPEYVLGLTDYNKLREILGYEKVSLQENEVIINCIKTAEKTFKQNINKTDELKISDKNLKIKEVKCENLAQVGFNGTIYMIVVPDSLIPLIDSMEQKLRITDSKDYYSTELEQVNETHIYDFDFNYKLVAQTQQMTDQKFYEELRNFIKKETKKQIVEVNRRKARM